jgi:ketol-acid reductoisomerase
MAKVYYEKDVNIDLLKGKTIAVIGYGNQGRGQSLNLKDNGFEVVVGLQEGSKSRAKAEADGVKVTSVTEAAKAAEIIMLLAPDMMHQKIYNQDIAPGMSKGNMLMVSHGFTVHYSQVVPSPDIDVSMIAPKSPGTLLRELFTQGQGVPALIAIFQDASGQAKDKALAYSMAIGCARAGVLETTFAEETETDLFGEQTILCGGVTALLKATFETLVEAGYQPELAYFECLNELKLIVDLIYKGGISFMRDSVSHTARYGDISRGPRVIDEGVRENLWEILGEIQDGTFAREWILENQAGMPVFNALTRKDREHPIEIVGAELRKMMPWLAK